MLMVAERDVWIAGAWGKVMDMPDPVTIRPGLWRRWASAAVALALFAAGCTSQRAFQNKNHPARWFGDSYEDPKAPQKLAHANELFQKKEFAQAEVIFRELADNTSNTKDLAEAARFMLAECRRMQSQYPEAVDTYHKLLVDFPTGLHRREACAGFMKSPTTGWTTSGKKWRNGRTSPASGGGTRGGRIRKKRPSPSSTRRAACSRHWSTFTRTT